MPSSAMWRERGELVCYRRTQRIHVRVGRPQHPNALPQQRKALVPCACLPAPEASTVQRGSEFKQAQSAQDAPEVISRQTSSSSSNGNSSGSDSKRSGTHDSKRSRFLRSANNILQFASSRFHRAEPEPASLLDLDGAQRSSSSTPSEVQTRHDPPLHRSATAGPSHTYDTHNDKVTFPRNTSMQHPTLKVLLDRWRDGSLPGQRTDGYKLGVAVEGGGMRGIISGAMLTWLDRHGFRNVFDAVYGSSAGAINATYFLTGQQAGLDIYIDYLAEGKNFLNFSSALRGRPIMSLEYLVDDVMRNHIKLDWQTVLESPIPLKCIVSSLDSLRSEVIENFANQEELALALKASASVPGFAGPPRVVRGQRVVDAAIFEPVPMDSAIADGCTHVLVLCTRPRDMRPLSVWRKRLNRGVENALRKTMLRQPYMKEALKVDVSLYEDHCDEILNFAAHSDPQALAEQCGAYILPVQPHTTGGCHPLCTDRNALQAGIHEGNLAIARAMSGLHEPSPAYDLPLADLERDLQRFRSEVQQQGPKRMARVQH